jgi:hypothetical protein
MDDLGKWILDVFTSINSGGRLGSPAASRKRVQAFLEHVGGEGVIQLSTLLNVGNAEAVRSIAASWPDLGEQLGCDEAQKSLDSYFANRSAYFEPYRKFAARGLSLQAGSTAVTFNEPGNPESTDSQAWEKVFQLLARRKGDGTESSDL